MNTLEAEWSKREESSFVESTEKALWGNGEWLNESDRIEWRFHGLPRFPMLIVRGPAGALCGYVGVPPGHPLNDGTHSLFGFDSCEGLQVHGGVTYCRLCVEGSHICHVAKPGEASEVLWFGFDCAHAGDLTPGMNYRSGMPGYAEDVYRNAEYVRDQCVKLAEQLSAMCKVAA